MNVRERAVDAREYAERLVRLQRAPWKRWLHVQAPFRWNLQRLRPGVTLEIGCGIGRNLRHLQTGSVGIDINEHCVRIARAEGLAAFTPAEFLESRYAASSFDSLLLSHVVEHMTEMQASALVAQYARYLRTGAQLILISPQEAGFRCDDTHVEIMDPAALERIALRAGFTPACALSFPFPRWAGRLFPFNESILVAKLDPQTTTAAASPHSTR